MERQSIFGFFIQRNGEKKFSFALSFEAFFVIIAALCVCVIGLAHACQKDTPTPAQDDQIQMSISPDIASVVTPTAFEATTSEIILKPAPPKKTVLPLPAAFSEPGGDVVLRYVKRFQKIAKIEQDKYGIPACIKMAQGIIESQSGQSEMARKENNHFGIKCHARNCAPGHCANYRDDSHKDFFRTFGSAWESWRAHSILLSGDRYKNLKGLNYKAYARGLKKAGYATDKNYADKIIKVIERYDLDRINNGDFFP